jgi:flagellar motor switch protein FliM
MDQGIFTNSELSGILESARTGRSVAGAAGPPKPEPFQFQSAGQLSPAQVAKLSEAHANFSSKLGGSLSTLLGSECKVTPAGAEQIGYGDLVGQMPAGAMFGTLHVPFPEATVFLHAELATVLPAIDLMLGGAGTAATAARPLTEIEQEVFKPVVDLFTSELKAVWAPLVESSPQYEYRGAAEDIFPAAQRVLALKFEIGIGELSGTWNLILPALLSNALVRKIEQQTTPAESTKSGASEGRLRERLLDGSFRLELSLPPTMVSVRMLANLKAGQVVVLKRRSSDPIDVNVEGVHLFQASPVSCGTRRGAQIKKVLPRAKKEKP